jgi:hypothetical protein
MPRAFNASAIRLSVFAPAFCGLADDRKDVRRVSVRLGLHDAHGVLAGLVEPWVTKGYNIVQLGQHECLDAARLMPKL